jgi:hypothetical protein
MYIPRACLTQLSYLSEEEIRLGEVSEFPKAGRQV